jgi:hypothetical protein
MRQITYQVGDAPCSCTEPTVTVTVPPRFFEDHAWRACLGHEVTASVSRDKLVADLHPCDIRELLSDARHYASGVSDYGPEFFGVCMSAKATVNAITKQGATS